MKQRIRLSAVFVILAVLLAAIVWLSLHIGGFRSETVPVILPQTTAFLPAGDESPAGGPLTAEVTPETVQAVVGTIVRPDSYSRSLRVESFWSGGSQSWNMQVWQKSGVTRIRMVTADGSQPAKNMQADAERVTIWYDGREGDAVTYTAAEAAMADALQFLPTYEDLRQLQPSQIEEAGYVLLNEEWRIMAAAREEPSGYRMIYYISIETGLLEAAERWDGETLLYRMTAETADLAAPADELFLPEG